MSLLASLMHRSRSPHIVAAESLHAAPEYRAGLMSGMIAEQDRLPEDRGIRDHPDYINLSSLVHDFCPRRRILQERGEASGEWNPRSADRVVWEMGRAAERHCRNQFIARVNALGVVGKWQCACKHTEHLGYYNPAVICPWCRQPANQYGEVDLYDHEAGIVGHPDFLVEFGGKLTVVEFKSMTIKQFNELTAPVADHCLQALSYRRKLQYMMRDAAMLAGHVIIVYVAKDYSFKGSVYKEFSVAWNTPTLVPGLALLRDQALIVKQFRTAGTIPPRLPACQSPSSRTAAACVACAACFARSA